LEILREGVAQSPAKADSHHEQYANFAGFVGGKLSGHGFGFLVGG
jgi:hypothetical protein